MINPQDVLRAKAKALGIEHPEKYPLSHLGKEIHDRQEINAIRKFLNEYGLELPPGAGLEKYSKTLCDLQQKLLSPYVGQQVTISNKNYVIERLFLRNGKVFTTLRPVDGGNKVQIGARQVLQSLGL